MLLAPPPARTAVRRTCWQGQTGSPTVRPDRARWLYSSYGPLCDFEHFNGGHFEKALKQTVHHMASLFVVRTKAT